MKELFKWMATHPDVVLEIENDDTPYGGLIITMRHKSWNVKSREIILVDLFELARTPEDIIMWTLDHHYNELIKTQAKVIDCRIDAILEEHNENCKHE